MSTIPTTASGVSAITPDAPTVIDSAVAAGRATRPAAITEQRRVPRLSIAELNQSDMEDLHQKYLKTAYDD
ncbi:hypothetical protein, partial [Klebsiella aerogenes]|uniref:hypothetical protein n=1 Tax=Klebsiella aerogenes TaxID=548 RepID=UPI001CBCC994